MIIKASHFFNPLLACCLCAFIACDEIDESSPVIFGELSVALYGEEFIETGIPAKDTADGWSVVFDQFLITLSEVKVGELYGSPLDSIDLTEKTEGSGQVVISSSVAVGEYSDPSFVITHLALSGSASKNGQIKTFNWQFNQETHYTACDTTIQISEGQSTRLEITVHADHFFYDSLVSEEPSLRFQALADADQNEDGDVTQAELETTDIGSYDPGSSGNINDLWTWLIAQSQTLGHVNGEGHCDSHAHAH